MTCSVRFACSKKGANSGRSRVPRLLRQAFQEAIDCLFAQGFVQQRRMTPIRHAETDQILLLALHAVEDASGSQVGPLLKTVGSRYDAAYLLESLLNPSATIAPGYGIVSATLRDGTNVSGTLSEETPEALTIRQFDGSQKTYPRSEVASVTPPVSIMPPMGGILEQRELRDVVAYLMTLKLGKR